MPAHLENTAQVAEPLQVAVRVDGVAVTPETEMLEGVQAGDRVAVVRQRLVLPHEVDLAKDDIRDPLVHRTDVEHLDLAKEGDVRHETVDAGPDVDVPAGAALEDAPRHQQVLVEVRPAPTGSSRSGRAASARGG